MPDNNIVSNKREVMMKFLVYFALWLVPFASVQAQEWWQYHRDDGQCIRPPIVDGKSLNPEYLTELILGCFISESMPEKGVVMVDCPSKNDPLAMRTIVFTKDLEECEFVKKTLSKIGSQRWVMGNPANGVNCIDTIQHPELSAENTNNVLEREGSECTAQSPVEGLLELVCDNGQTVFRFFDDEESCKYAAEIIRKQMQQ